MNRQTTKTAVRLGVGALLAILLVAGMAIGMAAVGAAEETDDGPEEFLSENVTKESSDDPLEIEVSFADEFGDDTVEVADADVSFYDADEYQNDSSVAALETDVISGEEGQTIANQFDIADYDSLEYGEDYVVVVEGDSNEIDGVSRLDGGGLFGGAGGSDGSPGFGVGVAVIAIALAALVGIRAKAE